MSSFRLRGFDPGCCGGRGGSGLLALGTGGLDGGAASAKIFGSAFSDLNFRAGSCHCGDGVASAGEMFFHARLLGKEPFMADPGWQRRSSRNLCRKKRELEKVEIKGEGFCRESAAAGGEMDGHEKTLNWNGGDGGSE